MSDTIDIAVTVNGASQRLTVAPNLVAADLLRETLMLTGCKVGCDQAVCGACTILVDGEPQTACTTFAFELDGKTVTTIEGLGKLARDNKLTLEQLSGGTFTISNGGVFGSLLSTPIVNPPQSGILGLHAVQDRPVAHNGQVVIRPIMYLALTYDHRIVDGQGAVTFLKRIKEVIEEPMRMLVEI